MSKDNLKIGEIQKKMRSDKEIKENNKRNLIFAVS